MKKISRRDFLKTSWLLASSLFLSTCKQDGSLTQAPADLSSLPTLTPHPTPVQTTTAEHTILRQPVALSEAVTYYLGYATEENMGWITEFNVDVLTRAFLLFLNANDTWLPDYKPRFEQLQAESRRVLVAVQAAVLVEDISQIPELTGDDPAMAYPQDLIPQWESYACRLPDGSPLKMNFSHACLNNTEFQAFFKGKLSLVMDSGVDGVHIDELQTRYFASQEGYCDACMDGFRGYLTRKFDDASLHDRYGVTSIDSFDFRDHLAQEGNLARPPQSLLHKEWWLFQLSNLVKVEREIKEFCKSSANQEGRDFLFNTNAYEPEFNTDRVIEMTLTDYTAIGTGLTINLRPDGKIVSTPRIPPKYSYLPLYAMAKALTPDKPVSLFIDGPGGTGVIQGYSEPEQDAIVRWMFAEAAATGTHFHVPYPSLDYHAPLEACKDFSRFISDNQDVLQGAAPMPDAGVVFSFASEIWDYWVNPASKEPNHVLQYYGLCQALTDMSIQYQTIFAADGTILPDTLSLEDLLKFPTIIVPWAYALNDAQVNLLKEFAMSGKKLVIAGSFALFDEEKIQRETGPDAELQAAGASLVPDLDLETYLNDPRGDSAPGILEQVAMLVPRRLVNVSNTSVTAHLQVKPGKLLCHLINRDLRESGFTPQHDLQVRFTLPPNFKVSDGSISFLTPDESPGERTSLQLVQQQNAQEVTVPQLETYGLLEIPFSA